MNITRNNYEEFFMLYADNELNALQRKEVEAFIAANTDLQHELALFQQFKLKPDADVVFENKELLMQHDTDRLNVSVTNYESFFVLYADNELTNDEKAGVEDFVYRHPQLQSAFELLQQVKLSADINIVFENKQILYRKEEDDKVIPFPWWRMAAAAAAIIFFVTGFFWVNSGKKIDQSTVAQNKNKTTTVKQSAQTTKDTIAEKNSKNNQSVKEEIATTNTVKENLPVKNIQPKNIVIVAITKKEIKQKDSNLHPVQTVIPKESIAQSDVDKLNNKAIVATNDRVKEPDTKKIAIANNTMPDQPSIILNPDEIEKAEYASLNTTNDNVEVLNTSVNTKSSLRGFLRKASRLIAKKTNGSDDSNRKSILIGGFEIAVR